MGQNMPSETEAAQQRSTVVYACASADQPIDETNSIRLLESRNVISGSGTTGLRTWEAALHLGEYLLSTPPAQTWVCDKIILELGAGTGLLSMLCARPLRAKAVLCTDGSEEVTNAVKENLGLNPGMQLVEASTLMWGCDVEDPSLAARVGERKVDTVIGADVTYDTSVIPLLVATIANVFRIWREADVLIAATIRNDHTFKAFEDACGKSTSLTMYSHTY